MCAYNTSSGLYLLPPVLTHMSGLTLLFVGTGTNEIDVTTNEVIEVLQISNCYHQNQNIQRFSFFFTNQKRVLRLIFGAKILVTTVDKIGYKTFAFGAFYCLFMNVIIHVPLLSCFVINPIVEYGEGYKLTEFTSFSINKKKLFMSSNSSLPLGPQYQCARGPHMAKAALTILDY